MSMTGSYHYAIDAKGRVVMPSLFREVFGSAFWLTLEGDGRLLGLSERGWVDLLAACPSYEMRQYLYAVSVEYTFCETTGRFGIPRFMRDYAGLRPHRDVILCGIGNAVLIGQSERMREWYEGGFQQTLGYLFQQLNGWEVPVHV